MKVLTIGNINIEGRFKESRLSNNMYVSINGKQSKSCKALKALFVKFISLPDLIIWKDLYLEKSEDWDAKVRSLMNQVADQEMLSTYTV